MPSHNNNLISPIKIIKPNRLITVMNPISSEKTIPLAINTFRENPSIIIKITLTNPIIPINRIKVNNSPTTPTNKDSINPTKKNPFKELTPRIIHPQSTLNSIQITNHQIFKINPLINLISPLIIPTPSAEPPHKFSSIKDLHSSIQTIIKSTKTNSSKIKLTDKTLPHSKKP
jgi:hypothetical protein